MADTILVEPLALNAFNQGSRVRPTEARSPLHITSSFFDNTTTSKPIETWSKGQIFVTNADNDLETPGSMLMLGQFTPLTSIKKLELKVSNLVASESIVVTPVIYTMRYDHDANVELKYRKLTYLVVDGDGDPITYDIQNAHSAIVIQDYDGSFNKTLIQIIKDDVDNDGDPHYSWNPQYYKDPYFVLGLELRTAATQATSMSWMQANIEFVVGTPSAMDANRKVLNSVSFFTNDGGNDPDVTITDFT